MAKMDWRRTRKYQTRTEWNEPDQGELWLQRVDKNHKYKPTAFDLEREQRQREQKRDARDAYGKITGRVSVKDTGPEGGERPPWE